MFLRKISLYIEVLLCFQALGELVCTDVAAAWTMYSFFQINTVAGMLMVPYQLWLTLATALNYRVAFDNEEEESEKSE